MTAIVSAEGWWYCATRAGAATSALLRNLTGAGRAAQSGTCLIAWRGCDIAITDGAGTAHLGELLSRVAGADKAAFAELYDATSGRLYGLIVRVLRDRGYSEEVTQETYLQIWRSAGSYRAELGSPLSWMMTLAHRRAVDRVRAEQAAARRERSFAESDQLVSFDVVADEVFTHAEAQEVVRCFSALTGKQFESVRLAYYDGLNSRQVADALGVPVPTAKSRIRDGLKALAQCLGVLKR